MRGTKEWECVRGVGGGGVKGAQFTGEQRNTAQTTGTFGLEIQRVPAH